MTLSLAARRQIGYALGRAAGGISWLLRDDFTTDLPAGSVNGTAAEPGPGTRTVVDIAGNKVSLSGGKAIIQPNYAWNNEVLRYSNVSSTVAGKLLITKVMVNNAYEARLSFGNAGNWSHGFLWDGLRAWGPVANMGGQPVNGAWQEYALVTRATGMFFFINAGYWRLLWMRTHTAPETQTVDLEAVTVKLEVDYVRVPDILWLPTPLASDGFGSAFGTTDGLGHAEGIAGGIGAGGGGVAWSNAGSTWSVSGGKAINTAPSGLSQQMSVLALSTANVFASVALTRAAGNVGLALSIDSASSPANGVLVYLDGTNCKVDKIVAGVTSNVRTTAVTYSAGAALVVAKISSEYRVYYNNALVGAANTISDAGIVNNTLHGMFSTDASNTLDDFTCYATGTGGEYATLDQYIQP